MKSHAELIEEVDRLRERIRLLVDSNKREGYKKLLSNIERLLNQVGDRGKCKDCGRDIWWVIHTKSGKKTPYTETALSHSSDCPRVKDFY